MLGGHGCLRFCFLCFLLILPAAGFAAESRVLGGEIAKQERAGFLAALLQRDKKLRIAGSVYSSRPFVDSSEALFSAELSNCGYGFEICGDAQDTVCLIARGTTTFAEKVANCVAGGGVGALIYNYLANDFQGVIGEPTSIPVHAVSQWVGQQLLSRIGQSIAYQYAESVDRAFFFCGGTYIGEGWVLTAAHCVEGRDAQGLWLAFGAGDYGDGRAVHEVTDVLVHEDFAATASSLGSDVALLKMQQLPAGVVPLALADWTDQLDAVAARDTVAVYGRGEQELVAAGGQAGGHSMSAVAYTGELGLIDSNACAAAMVGDQIESDMLCAGGVAGQGTCFGDSGGPLVWQRGGVRKLIGVVSWGVGCGIEGKYDVFASVAAYGDELAAVMSGEKQQLGGVSVSPLQLDGGGGGGSVLDVDLPSTGGGGAAWLFPLLLLPLWLRSGPTKHWKAAAEGHF